MPWRIPRFTTLQLLLAAALCALLLGLATASWRATDFAQVTAVAFSPRGQYLAAQYESGAIDVWDVAAGQPRRICQFPPIRGGPYYDGELAFVDEHRLVAVRPVGPAALDALCCIDVRTGQVVPILEKSLAPEGPFDAAGGIVALLHPTTGTIRCYNVHRRKLQSECQMRAAAWGLHVSRDGTSLVVLDQSGGAAIIDAATGNELHRVSAPEMWSVAFDGSRTLAYAEFGNMSVLLCDVQNGRQRGVVRFDQLGPAWLDFSVDGSRLVMANSACAVVVDVRSGEEVGRVAFPNESGHLLPFQLSYRSTWGKSEFSLSPQEDLLATFRDDRVLVWDLTAGKLRTQIKDYSRTLQTVLFTALFAAWSAAWGMVTLRNAERERQEAENARLKDISSPDPAVRSLTSFATTTLAAGEPPIEIKLGWGLMFIGGLVAMALPIYLFVHAGPVQWPMMYVSLFTGIAATAKGAGRQTTGLLWVTRGQLLNLLACDPINFVLGTLAFALLKRPHVRQYLALVNDLARSLR